MMRPGARTIKRGMGGGLSRRPGWLGPAKPWQVEGGPCEGHRNVCQIMSLLDICAGFRIRQ
jgi:hypothetical protein